MPRLTQQQRRARKKEKKQHHSASSVDMAHSSSADGTHPGLPGLSSQAQMRLVRALMQVDVAKRGLMHWQVEVAKQTSEHGHRSGGTTRWSCVTSLRERHTVCLRALQAVLPSEMLPVVGPKVWSFIRDPTRLLILRNHSTGHQDEDGVIEFEISLEEISLQSGRSLGVCNMELTELKYALLAQCLRGPNVMASSRDSGNELDEDGALVWCVWQRPFGFAYPRCNDTLNFPSNVTIFAGTGADCIQVASLSGGWIAKALVSGGCEVYDITSGVLLGKCDSVGVDEGIASRRDAFVMVAHHPMLLITACDFDTEAKQRVDVIQVQHRKDDPHVWKLSSTELEHKLSSGHNRFEPIAINEEWCAFVCGDLPNGWVGSATTVALYSLGEHGLSKCPHVKIKPHSGELFLDVALTVDKMVTLERSFEDSYEVVVRDCGLPHLPPILVLQQGNCLDSNIFCGSGLVGRVNLFFKLQAMEEDIRDKGAVIQNVKHDEPPAIRDERVIASQAEVSWADQVEQSTGMPHCAAVNATAQECTSTPSEVCEHLCKAEQVHLLRLGSPRSKTKTSENFCDVLLHSPQLIPCFKALASEGYEHLLPTGTVIAVKPEQYPDVVKNLTGFELHPFHIVITESLEYLLEELLLTLPFKRRPRLKRGSCGRQLLDVRPKASSEIDGQGTTEYEDADGQGVFQNDSFAAMERFITARTFICEAPCLHNARSVVQSTTEVIAPQSEAHYSNFRGMNPRRIQDPDFA